MLRTKICIILIFLLVGCSLRPTSQPSSSSGRELTKNGTSATAVNANNPLHSEQGPGPEKGSGSEEHARDL